MAEVLTGMCWPQGGTVGCITVTSPAIDGVFPGRHGNDGVARCCLVAAGKYRNGAARAWCRTHQHYWGVKADLAALAATGVRRCAAHAAPMGYAIDPPVLDLRAFERVSISHTAQGVQFVAQAHAAAPAPAVTVAALAIACDPTAPLFGEPAIVQVNLTPPALAALRRARHSGMATGSIDCKRCGHPHLDLGAFAGAAHRRHYCGHCGHDATHSPHAMVSNPLFALLRAYGERLHIADSNVHGHTVL
jgi:hypothetical protein